MWNKHGFEAWSLSLAALAVLLLVNAGRIPTPRELLTAAVGALCALVGC